MLLRISLLLVLLLGFGGTGGAQRAPVYQQRDYPVDSLRWLVRQPAIPDTIRVFYLNRLAVATGSTDLPAAIHYGQDAVARAQRIGYVRGQMNCLRVLANLHAMSGDYVVAQRYYEQGIALAKRNGKTEHLARLYLSLGAMASLTGNNERAVRYLLMSYAELKRAKSKTIGLADSAKLFSNLGTAYFELKQLAAARSYARRALTLFQRETKPADGVSDAYLLLARTYMEQPAPTPALLAAARRALQQALLISRRDRDLGQQAVALITLASLEQRRGDFAAMYQAATQGLALAVRVGSTPHQERAAVALAQAAAGRGKYDEAYHYAEMATGLNKINLGREKAMALEQLQIRYDVKEREQQIKLLTQQARTATIIAKSQQLRQRNLIGVASLLALGLMASTGLYWRLRRSRALLARANAEIRKSVAEKEVLVQEIHHRVKNNLQLVSSLLGWQSSLSSDPALVAVLAGSQARLQSMALVHEFLYRADNLARVRLDSYLSELLNSLHQSFNSSPTPIKLTAELEAVVMEAKEASAFGLLVNELVTNAYKHAFTGRAGGHLRITLTQGQSPGGFHLRISDDGVGLPASGLAGRPDSLGMRLVTVLAKQLRAVVTATPQRPAGTCMEVTRA